MALEYALVTAARNEADDIELTLKSVIAQTVLPKRWVIVSDGSMDGTDAIVESYLASREWMELVRLPERPERHFAGKALAFNLGCERVKDLACDVIGNLDGDVSFGEDYFEYLLEQFEKMPRLGVAGTHYIEGDFHLFRDSYISVQHVNGQCQLFRRQCLEDVGGYVPIRGGGIDWVAVTTARMKGWQTYSFDERVFTHHRAMGTAGGDVYQSRLHYGKKDYFLGGHPLWQLCRGLFQMTQKPYVLGGLLLIWGYFRAWATGIERTVPGELMRFHRAEQMKRLREVIGNRANLCR